MWRWCAALALAVLPSWGAAETLPKVVSVNLCTDQLALLVAEPEQIISLSKLADDPRLSAMAAEAEGFPKNNARAEAIVILQPDVVVAGQFTDPVLLDMLRNVGIDVVQFPLSRALSDVPQHLRAMGEAVSQEARAEELARDFEAELDALTAQRAGKDAPLAAFFYPNGFSLGAGTLSHDILTMAGARNLAVELGFAGNGFVSLEDIVFNRPDFLVTSPKYGGHSRSEDVTTHPVLRGFNKVFSGPSWVCGTPHVLRAVAQVAEQVAATQAE